MAAAWGHPSERSAANDSVPAKVRRVDEASVRTHAVRRNVVSGKPVQTMDRSELQALGIENLAEAVKKFAGTTVRDYGGLGGMKTVSVRNLGAHHTAVSLDGVTVSNTQAGQIDVGRFSLDNARQISLSIGDAADLMASARHFASAAVLSIETERPQLEHNSRLLRLKVQGGSFGWVSPTLYAAQRVGQRAIVTAEGNYNRADGTYPYRLTNVRRVTNEKRYNSDVEAWRGEANLFYTGADSSQLRLKTGYYYSERGLPGAVILYANASEQRLWDEDFFAQGSYQKQWNKHWQLRSRLKYTHTWNRFIDPRERQRDVDRQNEYYASATVGWHPVQPVEVALAEDVACNDLRNNINMNVQQEFPYPKRLTSLTSLSARYHTARWDVLGNVVGTYAHETAKAGLNPPEKRRLSPSLSATYRVWPEHSFFVRAMYKNTFRMPTFNDLYYRRMGSPGLRPEKATEYNVGLTWNGQPLRQVQYVSVTVDGYYNDVHDKIVAFPSTYVWKMANFGKARIYGVDVTLATELPLMGPKLSLTAVGAFTLQRAIDVSNPSSATYKNKLPYTPQRSGSLSLILNNPWVRVGYSVNYCGSRYSMGQNKPEYRIGAYAEHTLTLSRDVQLRTTRLSVQAGVVNLTNKQYEVIKYYPMPRRSWRASLIWHI